MTCHDGSMGGAGIFSYIHENHKNQLNVGEYIIVPWMVWISGSKSNSSFFTNVMHPENQVSSDHLTLGWFMYWIILPSYLRIIISVQNPCWWFYMSSYRGLYNPHLYGDCFISQLIRIPEDEPIRISWFMSCQGFERSSRSTQISRKFLIPIG